METQINKLEKFRLKFYSCFSKRKDAAMNLLDAISSFGHRCKSVVELSESPHFERQYSSITDAVADGLPDANWEEIEKLTFNTARADSPTAPIVFVTDCTPNPRPFSQVLTDKTVTHAPNPAPGNKPICVGHQYSLLGMLPNDQQAAEKHWLIPLAAQRVTSKQKGNEVGMQQIVSRIDQFNLADQLTISLGDSLYATETCRRIASTQKNLVHISRLNSTRAIFSPPEINHNQNQIGRKKEYGTKMILNNPSTHGPCDQIARSVFKAKKGKYYKVIIKSWKNRLIKGSREFKSSDNPINLIQICLVDDNDKPLFKKPLWLGVMGEKRHKLNLQDCFNYYISRYDVEHFFRFGKTKLLISSHQTFDAQHEELWWRLCLLAYFQLYLARLLAPKIPKPWERYLPEFKNNKETITTPSQTQREFAKVLKEVGTPARTCKPRGKPVGRKLGEVVGKRDSVPIIFKSKPKIKVTTPALNPISPGFEKDEVISNPGEIDALVLLIKKSLQQLGMSANQLAKMIVDTG